MALLLNYSGFDLEAGTDEAGRGCLAGPVVAAAVILPKTFSNAILNDSKKLTHLQRNKLKPIIEESAVAYKVAFIWPKKIDEINILQSSLLAMHKAIKGLGCTPEFIVVDGNKFNPYKNIPHQTIIKGDGKYLNIAAASVLAKTYRDAFMEKIHLDHPQYAWANNKGYPSKAHRAAIQEFGVTKHHRMTFKLLANQVKLNLK